MITGAPDNSRGRLADLERRIEALSTLAQLGREVRRAETRTELNFVLANETRRLVTYRQAALWSPYGLGRARIHTVSGTTRPDVHAPYVRWLTELATTAARGRRGGPPFQELGNDAPSPGMEDRATPAVSTMRMTRDDLDEVGAQGWDEWCPGYVVACSLCSGNGTPLGGILLLRDTALDEREQAVIEQIGEVYAHALAALGAGAPGVAARVFEKLGRRRLTVLVLTAVVALTLVPVDESVLSPATIIAHSPLIVAAPVDGIVARFHVQPNEAVAPGDALFSLDDTTFRNQLAIARKAVDVTRAELLQSAQRAFREPAAKAQIAILEAQVAEREAEVRYAEDLVSRITVRSERGGIAVFSDVNDWLGRPVRIGERVLAVANPARAEIEAWVEVSDALALAPGSRVRLFLDIDPTNPLEGELVRAAYEAQTTPAGPLAYRVVARFADEHTTPPRIGLAGTAKIYGARVRLGYLVMRRPFAWSRQRLGL